jgi:hypothetical protein
MFEIAVYVIALYCGLKLIGACALACDAYKINEFLTQCDSTRKDVQSELRLTGRLAALGALGGIAFFAVISVIGVYLS